MRAARLCLPLLLACSERVAELRTADPEPVGALPGGSSGGGEGGGGEGDGGAGEDGGAGDGGGDTSPRPDSGGPDDTAEPPPPPAPLRVAVLSDLNGSYGSTAYRAEVSGAVEALIADPPDLVLTTGDMVAGQKSGLDYAAMWASFHETVSDPLALAGLPFAVTPGNHDASGYSGYSEERDAFALAWADRLPAVDFVDSADFPFRYAFLQGDVLFVSLDDTLVGPLESEQLSWLDRMLSTPASARVVYGHVPLYPVAIGRESEALFDTDLEDLLNAHAVTAFIAGHHHAYYPGRRGDLRLVATACLGDGARQLIGTSPTSARSLLRFTIEEGALVELEAWTGDRFDTVVERSGLPESVGSGDEEITRDDL
jgi:hypothetical protein